MLKDKFNRFRKDNEKAIEQYKKLLTICLVWLVTVVATAIASASIVRFVRDLILI